MNRTMRILIPAAMLVVAISCCDAGPASGHSLDDDSRTVVLQVSGMQKSKSGAT